MSDTNQTMSKLEEIFRSELDDDALKISSTTTAEDVAAWDSLANIRIIAAVEREFGMEFDLDQIESIQGVADIVSALEAASAVS